jgi:hypothetical protein
MSDITNALIFEKGGFRVPMDTTKSGVTVLDGFSAMYNGVNRGTSPLNDPISVTKNDDYYDLETVLKICARNTKRREIINSVSPIRVYETKISTLDISNINMNG